MAALLESQSLTKNFGGLYAVNEVSYSIQDGQAVGIIGPNGSGKTTFFNLLSGYHRPSQGKIFLGGEEITDAPPHARTAMGIARTFQLVSVFESLSVWENLVLSTLRFKNREHRKAKLFFMTKSNTDDVLEDCLDALETVGLTDKAGKRTTELSYGDKRLLEIAIVLSLKPRILLLDEPFAGLSDYEIGFISELIVSLQGQFTQIIIEHKISKIVDMVARLSVLHNGRLIFEAEPEAVLANEEVRKIYWGQGDCT